MHKYGNPTHVLSLKTPVPQHDTCGDPVLVDTVYAVKTNRPGGMFYTPRVGFHNMDNVESIVEVDGEVPAEVINKWDNWV